MKNIIAALFGILATLFGSARADERKMDVTYAISPDRTELLVSVFENWEGGESYAYYFYNNASRRCYTYMIPGKWYASEESALLQSADGKASAGVLLYSAQELKEFEGEDLATRAANQATKMYEKEIGSPPVSVKVEPFESSMLGAVKWSAVWNAVIAGEHVKLDAKKYFVEIAPLWVAQISVDGSPDDDGLAKSILKTLGTTTDPECYWPFLRKWPFTEPMFGTILK